MSSEIAKYVGCRTTRILRLSEDIDVLEVTLDEALRGIETGQIVDGKTIMLIYHVALKGIL